jgi:hypothetical protein
MSVLMGSAARKSMERGKQVKIKFLQINIYNDAKIHFKN